MCLWVCDEWQNMLVCAWMCFHASLGVAQLKPAVYHSSLPCVTSKLHHAWFGLFMTQSQEGHVCLRWALCNKTWTRIEKKKNTAHLPILSLFFFQGYHVRKFLSRFWVQQYCGEISLALESRGIVYPCHVSFTRLQLKKLLWKLSGHREFKSPRCVLPFFLFCLETLGLSWLGKGWQEQKRG